MAGIIIFLLSGKPFLHEGASRCCIGIIQLRGGFYCFVPFPTDEKWHITSGMEPAALCRATRIAPDENDEELWYYWVQIALIICRPYLFSFPFNPGKTFWYGLGIGSNTGQYPRCWRQIFWKRAVYTEELQNTLK